jgi:hypothetical protein
MKPITRARWIKDLERRLAQRELSRRIVDAGYRALAKELHPDKGGSQEAMARLNRARDHLKEFA